MGKTQKNHPVWKIVKKDLGWDGGTIHQVAKECNCASRLLLAEPDDHIEIKLGDEWVYATFIAIDGFPLNEAGNRWTRITAFVPGFSNYALLSGVEANVSARMPIKQSLSANCHKGQG